MYSWMQPVPQLVLLLDESSSVNCPMRSMLLWQVCGRCWSCLNLNLPSFLQGERGEALL